MDFTALRYFCETANTRSIRAASERLHVAPSAISRQIAKLEHELRTPIFDRRAHGMTLTAAGEILQSKVEGIMREFARVTSHIAALQNLQSGTVDVYCFRTATETFVAPVLHEFYMRYPNVSFNITMSSTDEYNRGFNKPHCRNWSGRQSAGSRHDSKHRNLSRHDRGSRRPKSPACRMRNRNTEGNR